VQQDVPGAEELMRRRVLLLAAGLAIAGFAHAGVMPLDATACAAMQAHRVLNPGAPVGCERLAVVSFRYVDFGGVRRDDGRVVVLDAVAPAVERIFATLYARRFPIARTKPLEAYDGDDAASMADNNTSGFNHRLVENTARLSLHAYGAAIDLNPVQNPFLTRAGAIVTVAPPAGADWLNRSETRPGKAVRTGLAETVVDVFAENGFTEWGGDWDDPIDYQHFDIGRVLAEKLARLPARQAREVFDTAIAAYRHCIARVGVKLLPHRRQICASAAPH
jgi:hypothetical protein